MSIPPGSRSASPTNADDRRVEQIAAQLEEAEQQRLTDYRIEEGTLAQIHDRQRNPAGASIHDPHRNQSWARRRRSVWGTP